MNDIFDDDDEGSGENGGRKKTTKSLGIHFGEWTSFLCIMPCEIIEEGCFAIHVFV